MPHARPGIPVGLEFHHTIQRESALLARPWRPSRVIAKLNIAAAKLFRLTLETSRREDSPCEEPVPPFKGPALPSERSVSASLAFVITPVWSVRPGAACTGSQVPTFTQPSMVDTLEVNQTSSRPTHLSAYVCLLQDIL